MTLNEDREDALIWALSADIRTPFQVTNQERMFAKVLAFEVRRLRECLVKYEPGTNGK